MLERTNELKFRAMDVLKIIQENSLTVRCLPHTVVNHWTYREGDEGKKFVDSNGEPIKHKREYIVKDDRKVMRETREVEKGGWWYVKETKNIDSTVQFSSKFDKFFAPTIEQAIQMYLDSK